MTDPTERPDGASINEAALRALEADRARVVAAETAALRHRRSLVGRLERTGRWLTNRTGGPVPRARRVASVLKATIRERGPWRSLPEALATAALAPVRLPGRAAPPAPPRDWSSERAAAAARLAAFGARRLGSYSGGATAATTASATPDGSRRRPALHRRGSAAARAGTDRSDAGRLRVAVIADAEALAAYRGAWDVVTIRPEDWLGVLEAAPPDLLVVDSARRGNGGAWTYRIAWTAHPDFFLQRDLGALTAWSAARSIPSVFVVRDPGTAAVGEWSDSACLFDLVVAPDTDAATAYDAIPGRRGAGAAAVPAAAQPSAILTAMDGLERASGAAGRAGTAPVGAAP